MLQKKMGRPKAENPLDVELKVRLDARTAEQFRRYCEKRKIKRGSAIREIIKKAVIEDE